MPATKRSKKAARRAPKTGTSWSKISEPDVVPISRLMVPYAEHAIHWADDPDRCRRLVAQAWEKASQFSHPHASEGLSLEALEALIRVVEATAEGKSKLVPSHARVLATAALLYFVAPTEVAPDWTSYAGLTDDAAVVGLVHETIKSDLGTLRRSSWFKRKSPPPWAPRP